MSVKVSGKKIVPIVSGGIDSTVMLWYLKSHEARIAEAITFYYGQRHRKEIERAKVIVRKFNEVFSEEVIHRIVDMSFLKELIAIGALVGEDEVPHEIYDSETQRITIVPNRNMIMLSIAAGRAVTVQADLVAYAAHASDYEVYPDCRPEFVEALDKTLRLGNLWTPVGIAAPFVHMTKADIVKLGIQLNVPFEETWSCYEGGNRPCLECGTCLERTEAFLLSNARDPALNDEEWQLAIKLLKKHKQPGERLNE